MVLTWHTNPWHSFVCWIWAGACTVYVKAAATINTNNAVYDKLHIYPEDYRPSLQYVY
jgi:hypothetical protein